MAAKDICGKTFAVGDAVAKAQKIYVQDGLFVKLAKVTKVIGDHVYLDGSPMPLKFPNRILNVTKYR